MTRWTQADADAHAARIKGMYSAAMTRALPTYSKYNNVQTGSHASKREAKRAEELLLLESAGKIEGLAFQVPFELIPAQYLDGKCIERACKYVADAVYYEDGKRVVEDTKGYRNPVYRIKRKLMLHVHGIRIREV